MCPCELESVSLGASGVSDISEGEQGGAAWGGKLFSAPRAHWKVMLRMGTCTVFGWGVEGTQSEDRGEHQAGWTFRFFWSRVPDALSSVGRGWFALSVNKTVSGPCPKATCRCWNPSGNTPSNELMSSEMKLFHLSKPVCQILKSNRAYTNSQSG